MKKITTILLSCFLLIFSTVPIHAASGTDYGDGYTLHGSITNTYIAGYATGTNSSSVNITIFDAKYIDTSRKTIALPSKSAMVYISYYGTSFNNFWKWKSTKIHGMYNQYITSISLTNS